jgi:hypothetical protein
MSINNVQTVVGASNSLMSLSGIIASGDIASADGYSVMGDGGGGIFYFEGKLPSAANIRAASTVTAEISDATNATPIVIKASTEHEFSTGQSVLIQNVGGNTAANGTWIIEVVLTIPPVPPNTLAIQTFRLWGSIGNGA